MKITLTGPLKFTAPAQESDPGVRPYQGIAYTGGIMSNQLGPCVVDIRTLIFKTPLPLLLSHDHNLGAGMVDRIETGSEVRIFGRLFLDGPGGEIIQKGDQGFPWGLSLGLYASGITEVGEGESVVANGRALQGPFLLLRQSRLREISVCSVAADEDTAIRFNRPPRAVRLRNGRRIII